MDKIYKRSYIKSRDWAEIEQRYSELGEGFEPILNLVKHIRETELNERLFALTSMHKLVISIYETIEMESEALHIEFDTVARKWFFRYLPKNNEPAEFVKIYEEALGVEKFDLFVKLMKW
jgi:hypothetical protein